MRHWQLLSPGLETAPMQAPPTQGATGAETPVLVSLSSQEPPLPDGLNAIRCSCRFGCRRRCPVGRRIPCLVCLSPVGPCCGILAQYPLQGNQSSRLDIIVCHACLRAMEPAGCQWSDTSSEFTRMSAAESRCWHAWRAERIWEALLVELSNGESD